MIIRTTTGTAMATDIPIPTRTPIPIPTEPAMSTRRDFLKSMGALAAVPSLSADGSPGFTAGFQPGGSRDINQAVESQLDRTVARYDQIVAAAQPVLSASENQALDEYLGARMQEQEVGAQLTRAIVPVFLGTNRVPGGPAATGTVTVQTQVLETP